MQRVTKRRQRPGYVGAVTLMLVAIIGIPACGDDTAGRDHAAEQSVTVEFGGSATPTAVAVEPTVTALATATTSAPAAPPPAAMVVAEEIAAILSLPTDYRAAFVHYATIDRTDGDGMVRVMLIDAASYAVIEAGGELPADAVVIMETYQAARDAAGRLLTGQDDRLVAGELDKLLIRTRLADDGDEEATVPAAIRNGEIDYVTIDAARGAINSVNNTACHACHQQADAWNYLFTAPKLNLAAETGLPQYDRCDRVGRQACETPGH